MKLEESRKQFEEWMINTAKIKIGSRDPYPSGLERDYWIVWQASRENLPKIKLPEYLESYDNGELNSYNQGFNSGVLSTNKAIREAGYEVDDENS